MDITRQEYKQLTKQAAPRSPVLKNCVLAFLVGGLICAVGQVVVELATGAGMAIKAARLLCSLTLIALSAVLTGLNVYDNIAKHAGAGTLVPITGFANSIVSPAIEFKSEGLVLGMAAKMFIIAGPVLVYGISTSIVYGLVMFVLSLF